ncbi:MAG: HypC/HybG/HupF family hydrogenase formation chaperone [Fibrobacterota bacterium]
MCLSIPGKVVEIEGESAKVDINGVITSADISMIKKEGVSAGDYILVHTGYALQKFTPAEAKENLELYRRLMEDE